MTVPVDSGAANDTFPPEILTVSSTPLKVVTFIPDVKAVESTVESII